jgi:hypothetical protein
LGNGWSWPPFARQFLHGFRHRQFLHEQLQLTAPSFWGGTGVLRGGFCPCQASERWAGFFFYIFILFSTSCLAAHVEELPWRPKVRHGIDTAGEKPSGPGTLFARTLLLVNLQLAQTGSAMSSCCQKRQAEAWRWHRARQNL